MSGPLGALASCDEKVQDVALLIDPVPHLVDKATILALYRKQVPEPTVW